MILPIQLIWKSLLTTRRKLSIGAMFAVGGLCIIAAVIRLVQINSKTGDKNPNNEWIALWGSVEATTGTSRLPFNTLHIRQPNTTLVPLVLPRALVM